MVARQALASFALGLLLATAGCIGSFPGEEAEPSSANETASEDGPSGPSQDTIEVSTRLVVSATASECADQATICGFYVFYSEDPPEKPIVVNGDEPSNVHVNVTWDASTPASENLWLTATRDGEIVQETTGSSPIEVEWTMEPGSYTVGIQPDPQPVGAAVDQSVTYTIEGLVSPR